MVDKTGQNIHKGKEHGRGSLAKYLGAKREFSKVITVRPEGPFSALPGLSNDTIFPFKVKKARE